VSSNMQRYSMPSASIYDFVAGWLFRSRYEAIAKEIAAMATPDASVLDAGCGPGEVLTRLARVAPSLHLTGVDLDEPMIRRAREKSMRTVGPNGSGPRPPTFVVGDVAKLPFEDASFDLVVSSFSVHHWPDPHAGLAEVMRVLKPGGRAIVWDIAAPLDRPAAAAGPHRGATASGPHGRPAAPTQHGIGGTPVTGPSWWLALRMLLQFRKAVPQRFEFAKPA